MTSSEETVTMATIVLISTTAKIYFGDLAHLLKNTLNPFILLMKLKTMSLTILMPLGC